jgi:iron complex outermembrane receptor protein
MTALAGSTALSAAAVVLGAAAPAVAQPAATAPANANTVAEIIVTAQKRAENIQDVPVAVTVVGSQTLQDNQVNSAQFLNEVVPSLTFKQGTTNLNSTVAIRGIGTQSFAAGAEPSVSVLVDGVVMGRAGMAFSEFTDVDHIEVLGGPQNTLFGKNAEAGAVLIVTKDPTSTFHADLTGAYFQGDEFKTTALISGPINDRTNYIVSAVYDEYPGNVENLYNNHTVNGYNNAGIRGKIVSRITEDLKLSFTADYVNENDNCCADIIGPLIPNAQISNIWLPSMPGVHPGRGNLTVDNDTSPATKDRNGGVSAQLDWKFGGGYAVTSITAWRNWRNVQVRDGDFHGSWGGHVASMDLQTWDYGSLNYNQYSEELRLASPSGQAVEWLVGGFLWHSTDNEDFTRFVNRCTASTLPADSTGFKPCSTAPGVSTFQSNKGPSVYGAEFKSQAIFGQATWKVLPRLRAIGGARFTNDEVSYYLNRNEPVSGVPGISTSFAGSGVNHASKWAGKLGLQYDLTSGVMAYATYSRGYKGPAFNVFYNMTALNTAPVPPETNDAWEAGVKSELFGRRLVLDVDVFVENIRNFQANTFITVNGGVATNLSSFGVVRSEGIEANAIWRATSDLTLSGGYIYDDAYVAHAHCVPGAPASCARPDGSPLPFAPRDKGNVTASWRVPVPESLPFNLRAESTYSYQSWTNYDITQTPLARQPAYGIWNANITASTKDDRYELSFIARNILNQYYTTFITPVGNGVSAGSFTRLQVPQDGQEYVGVQLRAKF